MIYKGILSLILGLTITTAVFGQDDKPALGDKSATATFHRLILGLKEYRDEHEKLPALRKQNGNQPVKIVVYIDKPSADADDDASANMLTGYIREQTGADTTDAYVIQYDKIKKTIISVKNVGASEVGAKDDADDDEKVAKPRHKKADDDDAADDAPKKHHKKSDDDDE